MAAQTALVESTSCYLPSARPLQDANGGDGVRRLWLRSQSTPDVHFGVFHKLCCAGGDISPYVLELRNRDVPTAILAGQIRRKAFNWKVGPWTASTNADLLEFPRGALMGDSSPETCAIFVDHVLESLHGGAAAVALFRGLAPDGNLYREAARRPNFASRDYVRHHMTRWGTTVPSNLDEFYRRLSSHRRSEIRRKIRRFQSEFSEGIEIRRFAESGDLKTIVREAESVAKRSYQRSLGGGFDNSDSLRSALQAHCEENILRCYVLYLKEVPIAFWLGVLFGETFYGRYMAHDLAYNHWGAGIFLMMNVVEQFCGHCSDHVSYIDVGTGDYPYKQWLCDQTHEEASVHIFAPTLRGFALNAVRTPTTAIDYAARNLASRANLLNRARKARRVLLLSKAKLDKHAA